jgi:serine/threonine-protein kinase
MDPTAPATIGRYRIERVLGSGGAGTVYYATDPVIARPVAIKVLMGKVPDLEQRFSREIQAIGRLAHVNVANIFDVGRTADGDVYVVQEFFDGRDLANVLSDHPDGLSAPVAVGLLLQVARALAHAHARGVVHRDVKPGNVLVLGDGTAKLLDFGIARLAEQGRQGLTITRPGTMVGTPQYMAPEQVRGESTNDRSVDVYGFGALAYELLAGHPPFVAEDFTTILWKTLNEEPPPLPANVPPALGRIVLACLRKDPNARPPDLDEVVRQMETMTTGWGPDVLAGPAVRAPAPPGQALPARPAGLDGPDRQGASRPATVTDRLAPDAASPPGRPMPQPDAPVMPLPPMTSPGGYGSHGYGAGPGAPRSATIVHTAPWPVMPPRDLVGAQVGRFTLHERISRGKTGELFKAFDPVRGELVAVKVVLAADAASRERLLRGGRIWIRLAHPNIVRVHEVHPDYGGLAGVIVTDLVDGIDLIELSARRSPSLDEGVWIVLQLCEALAAIHALGVVHREVKPANILVTGPQLHVTLLDSGIARHENPEVDAFTKTGIFVGDLAYAAPETMTGHGDQRSDIYAAVAVLYELVTQRRMPSPLPPGWRPPADELAVLPARLRAVIERGLQPDPRRRFATITEVRDQLRPLAAHAAPAARRGAVAALHGIRTQAAWQRAFSEVATHGGMAAHVDRWNFGYFSVLRFLMPWARLAKVRWFRETYQREFREAAAGASSTGAASDRPSIVAHSFGTYILGNALLRYPYLRFDKVLLCGSILPCDFPWAALLERGQVQAVRNEFGRHDVWTRAVAWFVPGTGPSGLRGFDAVHARLEQERFEFEHSEYFERGHMEIRWIPFLTAEVEQRAAREIEIEPPRGAPRPWGLYALYVAIIAAAAALAWPRSFGL